MAADTVLIATISDLIACRLMKYHRHLVSRHLVLIPKLALIPMSTMATNAGKLMGRDLCKADLRFTSFALAGLLAAVRADSQ